MFTDELTQINIHANLDETVVRATHRPQDLLPAFLKVIKDTPEYQQLMFNSGHSIIPSAALKDDDHEWWDSEDCSYLVNEELYDVLNSYAPEDYYFGVHMGDGSDFGYWKDGVDS